MLNGAHSSGRVLRRIPAGASVALAVTRGGCAGTGTALLDGSAGSGPQPIVRTSESGPSSFETKPAAQATAPAPPAAAAAGAQPAPAASAIGDPPSTLVQARRLKAEGKRKEALAALDAAAEAHPTHHGLLVERGLLALELGHAKKAQRLLAEALPVAEKQKEWRVLSGLGVAYATEGKQAEAQRTFQKALAAAPGNPTVLNNLAMSYLMERKTEQAEAALRQAAKGGTPSPRLTQNLALAQALQADPGEGPIAAGGGGEAQPRPAKAATTMQ